MKREEVGPIARGPVTATPTPTRITDVTGNLAFGNVPVGASKTATFTIRNTGNAMLTVSSLTVTNGLNQVLLAGWLSGTLAPGSSRQVNVQFSPASAQDYSGLLNVVSDATSGVSTVPITGPAAHVS
jgi:hypothetical protein